MKTPPATPNSSDHDHFDHSRSPIRDELIEVMKSWGCVLPAAMDDQSSLITSGLLDSLALFNLMLWVETKTGHRIDPTSVNVAYEWDSIANILQHIRRANSAPHRLDVSQSRPTALSLPQSGYRIVRYNPDYKQVVAKLQTGLWSPDQELNLRYLEWKYERNPYANQGRIYLAFYKDLLVGMRGFYPSRWEAGDPARQVPILVADDLLVREDYRNQGLVTKIMQAAFEDLRDVDSQFLFNLSGSRLTVLNSLAMGWQSIGMLRPMGRRSFESRLFRVLRPKVSGLPYVGRIAEYRLFSDKTKRSPFRRFDQMVTRSLTEQGVRVDIDTRPRPDEMARLIRRIRYDGRLRHVRDEPYLDWRFQNPLHEYRFLYVAVNEGKELDGYLVLKRSIDRPEPSSRVSIVDIEAVSSRIQEALLKTAVTAGAFYEIDIWTSTFNDPMLERLSTLRFEPFDSEQAAFGCPCFLVRPIDSERPEEEWSLGEVKLLDRRNWDIRMLYSMSG